MNKVRLAWTIFKLKCVRVLLRPLVRLHTWHLLKDQNKTEDKSLNLTKRTVNRKKTDMQGPDAMMEYLAAKAKEKKDDKL